MKLFILVTIVIYLSTVSAAPSSVISDTGNTFVEYVKNKTSHIFAPAADAIKAITIRVIEFFDRRYPLMAAASYNDIPAAEELLKTYKVDVETNSGHTPLMFASQFGHLRMVQYLVSEGANVNHVDRDGATALVLASNRGHTEIVKFLIQSGADAKHGKGNGIESSQTFENELVAPADKLVARDGALYGLYTTTDKPTNGSGITKNTFIEMSFLCALIYGLKTIIQLAR